MVMAPRTHYTDYTYDTHDERDTHYTHDAHCMNDTHTTSHKTQITGTHMLMVTVVQRDSERVETQPQDATVRELMTVLRSLLLTDVLTGSFNWFANEFLNALFLETFFLLVHACSQGDVRRWRSRPGGRIGTKVAEQPCLPRLLVECCRRYDETGF